MSPRRNGTTSPDWPIAPYPAAPSAAERLARVEERLDNLIDRVDRGARSTRYWVTIGVAAAAAVGPVAAALVGHG